MTLLSTDRSPDRPTRPLSTDTVDVACRNCGHRRPMTWAVARLLPRDDAGRPYTEVCHACLNMERGVGDADKW